MNRTVIRGVAVALIALPEPITTAAGVTLLAASYAVKRKTGWPTEQQCVQNAMQAYRPSQLRLQIGGPVEDYLVVRVPNARKLKSRQTAGSRDVRRANPAATPQENVIHHELNRDLFVQHRGSLRPRKHMQVPANQLPLPLFARPD